MGHLTFLFARRYNFPEELSRHPLRVALKAPAEGEK